MAAPYYGDIAEDATIYIPFNVFDSNDPSESATITDFANTDVHIHKGAGASSSTLSTTQRNSANGITVDIDFDGITGNHVVTIDTSENTSPAGFYVTGQEYLVRIEGATVDAGTINAWIGSFSIERAGGVIALLKLIQTAVITNAAGADIATDIVAVKAETANILEDTGTTLQAEIDAIQAAVITNAAGADIAADIIAAQTDLDTLTDARGEPAQGAPGASETTNTKIDWLYKFLRNQVWTTATQISVYNDAADTIDHKSTISDDGATFKRGEIVSGA